MEDHPNSWHDVKLVWVLAYSGLFQNVDSKLLMP